MTNLPPKPTVHHSLQDITFPAQGNASKPESLPEGIASTSQRTLLPTGQGVGQSPKSDASEDPQIAGRQQEIERLSRIIAVKDQENKRLKDENDLLRPRLFDLRRSCQEAESRLTELQAEANRLAARLPEGRLAAIQLKERQIAERERQLDQDFSEAVSLGQMAEAEADARMRDAQEKVEALMRDARTAIDSRMEVVSCQEAELSRRSAELEAQRKDVGSRLSLALHTLKAQGEKILRLESEKATHLAACNRLAKQLEIQAQAIAQYRASHDTACSALSAADEMIHSLRRDLNDAEAKIREAAGQLFAHYPRTTAWLASLEKVGDNLHWSEQIASTGSGPFKDSFIGSILERHGHTVHSCGNSDAGVLIVGREAWTREELEEQIDSREGGALRVYSQEMAIIAIVTGHDPFEAGETVLLEMGKGHPALEALIEVSFRWPAFHAHFGDVYIDGSLWKQNSPLTAMGYHVGMTSPLSDEARRRLLGSIFRGRLIFPDYFSDYEKRAWGQPGTAARLQKMASHISGNVCLHGARLGYDSTAITEWKRDLAWLKKTFYAKSLRFRWPDVFV